jgi:hypothetical protein
MMHNRFEPGWGGAPLHQKKFWETFFSILSLFSFYPSIFVEYFSSARYAGAYSHCKLYLYCSISKTNETNNVFLFLVFFVAPFSFNSFHPGGCDLGLYKRIGYKKRIVKKCGSLHRQWRYFLPTEISEIFTILAYTFFNNYIFIPVPHFLHAFLYLTN